MLQFSVAGVCRKVFSLFVCVTFLAGCASHSSEELDLTPVQRQLRAERERYNSTMITGALAGAALGAGIGAAAGSGSKNTAAGAGIGLLAGLVVGLVAGAMVAERNLQFERQDISAAQRIQAAQQTAQQLQQRAATAEMVARENREKLDQLDTKFRAQQISANKYRAEAATIRKDVELIKESAAEAKNAREKLVTSSSQVPALIQEEPKLRDAQHRLERAEKELNETVKRIPTT